jgi:GT2 family glycosyltransferase
VRYTCEPVPGLDIARNRALRESETEVIAYIDDDAAPDRWWCEALVAAWAEHPDASAITGLVLPLELDTEAQVLFELMGGFGEGWQTVRYRGPTHEGSALYPFAAGGFGAGCNMSFRRSAALRAGGFDEALDTGPPLPGGGDLDMLHRIVRHGGTLIYEPSIVVFHRHRRERDALRRQYTSWGKSFMAFLVKCHRYDRAGRPAIRRTVRWWWRWQVGRLAGSLRRRSAVPPDLVMAELIGAAVGLMGEYGRSRRRMAKRQKDAKPVTVAPRTGTRPAGSTGS